MAPPMGVAFAAMMVFNLTDTWFVGRLGTEPLAAMGFTFPVVMVAFSLAMGFGLGASSCVSRLIGSGDHERVGQLATAALVLTTLVMTALMVAGIWVMDDLFVLLGAPDGVRELTLSYMKVWFLFLPFTTLPMVANNVIRATGDALRPSVLMGMACLINIGLDPILIFGWGPVPAMGMAGAAWATVLSRLIILLGSFYILKVRLDLIHLKWVGWRSMCADWAMVLHVALPAAATNVLMPLTAGIITRLIATHGTAAVAATTVGQRMEQMAHLVPMAMGSSLVPIIGQNWGARRVDRVRKAWVLTNTFGMLYTGTFLVLMLFAANSIAGLFSSDSEVVRVAALYIRISAVGSMMMHIVVHTGFAFNATGQPIKASLLTVIRLFALVLPLVLLGNYCCGLLGMYWGMALGHLICGGLALIWFSHFLRHQHRA